MKPLFLAAALAIAPVSLASGAFAQTPPAPAAAAGKIDVAKTTISAIIANPAAKAILDKEIPTLAPYYDLVGGQTLVEVMPESRGAVTEEKLKVLQAAFEKLG